MNVSIDFTGGGGDPHSSNSRLKPKPILLFETNPLSLFKIKSYTCLKCCKKVEVKPGGYLQKNDSNSQNQNPVTSLLCVECFQIKTRSHSPALSRDDESSSTDEQDEDEQNGHENYRDSPPEQTGSNDHLHDGSIDNNGNPESNTNLNSDPKNGTVGKYTGTSTGRVSLPHEGCEISREALEQKIQRDSAKISAQRPGGGGADVKGQNGFEEKQQNRKIGRNSTNVNASASQTESIKIAENPKLKEPKQLNPELLYWFKCTNCEDKFLSHSKLDFHLAECHAEAGAPAIRCQHCDKSFKAYSSYLSHNSIHMDMIEYLCKYCGQDFSTEKEYCTHLAIHCKSCHECDHCGYIYGEINDLNLHKELVHKETKDVQDDANKIVLEQSNQSAVVQQQLVPFTATKLTTSTTQEQLPQHPRWIPRIRIGSDEHQCQTCKVNCPSAKYLASHIEALHSSNHFCALCSKQFTTKTNLQKHQVQAHGDYRPYGCKTCGKSFKLNYQLKSHEMTHSTEKNFACSICGKMFLNQSYVNCHYRYTHLGIKYYGGRGKEKRKAGKAKQQQPMADNMPFDLSGVKGNDNASTPAKELTSYNTVAYDNAAGSDNQQVKVKPKRKYTKRMKIEDSYVSTNYNEKTIIDSASAEGREMTHLTENNFASSICGDKFETELSVNSHYRNRHVADDGLRFYTSLNAPDCEATTGKEPVSDKQQVKVKPKRKYTKRKKIEDSYGPTNYYEKTITDAASAEGAAAAASNKSRRSGRMRKLSSKYI